MNLKPRPREEPELNLISLVDVVLLLLIFFMMSTTFVDEAKLRIELPEASAPAVHGAPRDRLEVTVTREGTYRVNGRALLNTSPQTLSAALAKEAGQSRDLAVTVRADGRAQHQAVVTALDVVGRLGFHTINIATVNQTPAAADTQ